MNSPKAFLGITVIFLVGISIGALGMHCFSIWKVSEALERPRDFSAFLSKRISRVLHLDGAQNQKLMEVVKGSREKLNAVRSESLPQVSVIFQESEQAIMSFLRPEQLKRFEKMIEKRKRFFRNLLGST